MGEQVATLAAGPFSSQKKSTWLLSDTSTAQGSACRSHQISCRSRACFLMVASGCCRTRCHLCLPGRKKEEEVGAVPTWCREAQTSPEAPWAHKASLVRLGPRAKRKLGSPKEGLTAQDHPRRISPLPGKRGMGWHRQPREFATMRNRGLCITLPCLGNVLPKCMSPESQDVALFGYRTLQM